MNNLLINTWTNSSYSHWQMTTRLNTKTQSANLYSNDEQCVILVTQKPNIYAVCCIFNVCKPDGMLINKLLIDQLID